MADDWSQDVADDAAFMPHRRVPADTEMDITPMIDITFLLLIFFLVTSTMAQSGPQLPKARYGTGVNPSESVIVAIEPTGEGQPPEYYLVGKGGTERLPNEPDFLEARVQQALEQGVQDGKKYLVIKADKISRIGDVNRVAAMVNHVEGMELHYGTKETEEFD